MLLAKITKKGIFQKGNHMLKISENARKIPKNTEKIPTDLESAQIANKSQKYSNKLFFWLEKSGKNLKKLP